MTCVISRQPLPPKRSPRIFFLPSYLPIICSHLSRFHLVMPLRISLLWWNEIGMSRKKAGQPTTHSFLFNRSPFTGNILIACFLFVRIMFDFLDIYKPGAKAYPFAACFFFLGGFFCPNRSPSAAYGGFFKRTLPFPCSTGAINVPRRTREVPGRTREVPSWTCVRPRRTREVPSWTCVRPRRTREVPSWTSVRPSWTREAPSWTSVRPSWTREAPKWTSVRPRWTREAPRKTSVRPGEHAGKKRGQARGKKRGQARNKMPWATKTRR